MIWGWIAAGVLYAAGIGCVVRGARQLHRRRRARRTAHDGDRDE